MEILTNRNELRKETGEIIKSGSASMNISPHVYISGVQSV